MSGERQKIYLLCSTNWNPRFPNAPPNQMLAPLRTALKHLEQNEFELVKLILIKGTFEQDNQYCSLVIQELAGKAAFSAEVDDGASSKIASYVSRYADEAWLHQSELWVDLTPGPKQRTAVIFAAASAVPDVSIMYAELGIGGEYELRSFPGLDSYNQWLGRHGILIRNYAEELRDLAEAAQNAGRGFDTASLLSSVSDMLGSPPGITPSALSPRSNLLTLAEWVSNVAVPQNLPGLSLSSKIRSWQSYDSGKTCDDGIRNLSNEWLRSAGRASQMVYQLRNLFAHPTRDGYQLGIHDAMALLDGLIFLAARLKLNTQRLVRQVEKAYDKPIFIAVDGDDVGRRFEERLANCVNPEQVESLRRWSQRMHQDLSDHMIELMDCWEASFIARTGDGFLASVPTIHFDELKTHFRPRLLDATVTTGIGCTVKDAYLALKLGKARNRGGGIFFSLNPFDETILWKEEQHTVPVYVT